MTEQLVVGLLAALAAGWIARPLWERRRRPAAKPADRRRADLLEAKQSVYRSIIDLEQDHEMGKLEEDDYLRLRRQSKAEALGILRELDSGMEAGTEQDALEAEIQAARERLRKQ